MTPTTPATTGTEAGDQAAGVISPSGVYNPNTPVASITPTTPVSIPDNNAPTYDYKAIMAGLNTAQSSVDNTISKISTDTTQQGQQSTDQAAFEDQYGVTADKASLNDLNTQLNSLNNEANAESIKAEGQPIELGSITGQQRQIEHERTIKALGLSSSIQAMQGNLTLANDQVTRAINMKYDPIKADITNLNNQLTANYKNLSQAEQQQSDALKASNDAKLKQIDVQVAADKDWSTTKNTALSNGAPLNVVQQAQTLRDQGNDDAARALLGNYTGTKGNQVIGYDAQGNPIYQNPGGGSGQFTTANLNKGAALAGVSTDDFKKFSSEGANAFVNNYAAISAKEKEIYSSIHPSPTSAEQTANIAAGKPAIPNPSNPSDIEKAISEQNIPPEVKDYLTKYLKSL